MKLAIISGSNRKTSNSEKVAQYMAGKPGQQAGFSETNVIALAHLFVPVWSEDMEVSGSDLAQIKQSLAESDAIILIIPEWGGMCPSQVKNLLLHLTGAEVGHKPCLIVTVSAGAGGAFPVSEIRMSGYKNNHICFLPDHVIVRQAGNVLTESEAQNDSEQRLRDRIAYSLALLAEYGKGLKLVRASQVPNYTEFNNGMS